MNLTMMANLTSGATDAACSGDRLINRMRFNTAVLYLPVVAAVVHRVFIPQDGLQDGQQELNQKGGYKAQPRGKITVDAVTQGRRQCGLPGHYC